jgi:hypothetical protein
VICVRLAVDLALKGDVAATEVAVIIIIINQDVSRMQLNVKAIGSGEAKDGRGGTAVALEDGAAAEPATTSVVMKHDA